VPWFARAAGGYTLVEVLIAVLVFAVLAARCLCGPRRTERAQPWTSARTPTELAELQMAVARLDADLRQLATRPVRGPDGRHEPALAGERNRLAATRAGWANPASQRRGSLQRISWQFSHNELQRSGWPVTDRVPATQVWSETLLEGVALVEFRYRDRQGRWRDEWPSGNDEITHLPTAIEVTLESERFGRIRRLVVLQ
jgi:general secretion pathway protein J